RITSSDTHEGRGPTGRAVREGEHFICNDIEHEEYMLPWRDEALKRGYRSSAAFPIIVEKHVIGVINFYSTEASFFNEEEIKLLFDVAEDLSFAVAFIEGEKIRRQAEKELENRITELEKFYEMAIGRELKMKELKEEIARLKTELEKYKKGGEIAGGANQ
ncbi:MAG: GAF domain-containing protein, partial [Thermodesulfovibrionales bacterium]|nr:GAF domain-containing protein [Thermodesulfovibrionales bacterium]